MVWQETKRHAADSVNLMAKGHVVEEVAGSELEAGFGDTY